MWELRECTPGISRQRLVRAGFSVGKDILGMMAITIILICVGSNFEMLFLFHYRGLPEAPARLLNHEEIAAEIVRMMSCGWALALAIPFTSIIAAISSGGTDGKKHR